jgi:hypothetical protein
MAAGEEAKSFSILEQGPEFGRPSRQLASIIRTDEGAEPMTLMIPRPTLRLLPNTRHPNDTVEVISYAAGE